MAAGVIEDGKLSEMEQGTPQGAPVSPLLANVYLHHVLDLWAVWWRNHEARGDVIIVRFADNFVTGWGPRRRRRCSAALREGSRESAWSCSRADGLIKVGVRRSRQKPGCRGNRNWFSTLGLTHICAINKRGQFWVRRITDRKRLTAKLAKLKAGLLRRRHNPRPTRAYGWPASLTGT